jgi:hypothetical protein
MSLPTSPLEPEPGPRGFGEADDGAVDGDVGFRTVTSYVEVTGLEPQARRLHKPKAHQPRR